MKTDYRVICCIVAWLSIAAVHCRKENSDWDNIGGNGLEDFGREYDGDDDLSFLGKAYDISKDVLRADDNEDEDETACGEECTSTGGTCKPAGEPPVEKCSCPDDTVLEGKGCKVEVTKCKELLADCVATGGSCVSSTDGIKCSNCPTDTTLDEKQEKCIVEATKCEELLADCVATGGSCVSSTNGIKCSNCPTDTTLDEKQEKCIVEVTKCEELLADCVATKGSCTSSTDGIKCSNCPTDTTLDKKQEKCILESTKCTEQFPACQPTGGSCVSLTDGVKCSCPYGLTLLEGSNLCLADESKCGEVLPSCKSTGGKCVPSPKGITCKCPTDTSLEDTEKKCIVADTKCEEKFPNCKSSGGVCSSSIEGIKCDCPKDTNFDNKTNVCIVNTTKCAEIHPNCPKTGGSCASLPEGIKCSCPEKTTLVDAENKCVVEEAKCLELLPNCTKTGGRCVSSPGEIVCICPEGTTLEDTENKCVVEDKKCKDKFPNCKTTGGACVSTDGGIKCSCPPDTSFQEEGGKCIVEEAKCIELLPGCKPTGGTCLSSTDGIKCSCPEDTTFKDTEKKCIVNEAKCLALYPNCETTGGTCLSSTEGIKCNCPDSTTFSGTEKKCTVDEAKCADLFPKCNSSGGSCVSSPGGIKCSCPEGLAFKDTEQICAACTCGDKSTGCKFEGDVKICTCENKFADKQGTCSECDCGPKSKECKFDADKKVCTCDKGYEDKEGICKVTKCTEKCGEGYEDKGIECTTPENGQIECQCQETTKGFDYTAKQCKDCNCGSDSTGCKFVNDKKECFCNDGYAEKDGKCTACDCGEAATGCTYDKKGKTCQCEKHYADKNGKCEKCDCDDEVSTGCSFKGEDKTCECKKDYANNNGICKKDYCQIKCGCQAGGCGDDIYCDEKNKFEEEKAKCGCNDEPTKKFDSRLKECRKPCADDKDCKHEAECKLDVEDKFCVCLDGKTSGDTCAKIVDCGEGGKYEKCVGDQGTCGFDEKKKEAICVCKKGKRLDDTKNYCVHVFCVEGNCKDTSECQYDNETHTGYCQCSKKGEYYDYQANLCKGPDKCLLKKKACEENEICVDGACKCLPPFEKDGDKCIKKFCKPNPCFTGASCSEESSSCYCEEGKIFTGSKCEERKCILNDDYDEKCNCPRGVNRGNGTKCVVPPEKACDKDCGYGLCVNTVCRCFEGAELKKETCVLKTSFCASGQLLPGFPSQCNCTGHLKPTKDKKTCELVTCDDDSAKTFCAQMGATCKMTWRGTPRFECECPKGYVMDLDRKICTDPCSLQRNVDRCLAEQKFCFNSNSEQNSLTGDCKCPPPFTNAAGCNKLDENIHLISGIPVSKKPYEMKHGINHVLLNTNLTQSLAQTYSSAVFDYGYLYDYEVTDKEILCSVWVRFKKNASEHLERLPYQAKQFTEGVCEDCDTSMFVWPPALPLTRKLAEVHYENLNLCSPAVKDKLCGREASCNDKVGCFCPKGFRMLEYTLRLTANGKRLQRCEGTTKGGDLDECKAGTHNCTENSECVKIPGDFICQCKPGFWKGNNYDKQDCQGLCTQKPCKKGKCSMKNENFNCECEPGYGGSRCDQEDLNFASAKKSTVIVGVVLGTILVVGIIAFLLYYRKIRKSSYSEDFMPAPSHSEMTERRPMRGVVNKSYE